MTCLLYALVPLMLVCSLLPLHSEEDPLSLAALNSTMDTEFWIAIPPILNIAGQSELLAIEVTALEDSEVTLEAPRLGMRFTRSVKARRTTSFSTEDISALRALEVQESELREEKGILVKADKPVTVSVVTSKVSATDGYLALPRKLWGTQYRHLSYYDSEIDEFPSAGGFIIIAAEDATVVDIVLQGRSTQGETIRGHRPGYAETIQLRRGQVYMVRGDGKTRGSFDLSGSLISASKPIGLISFHSRLRLPASSSLAPGALSEMLPPISAWGKQFVSMGFSGAERQQGSYYRLMAAQADTRYEVRHYDRGNGKLLSRKSGVLLSAGDFRAIEEANPAADIESFFNELTVWEADKPILLMQYSFSTSISESRTFMLTVPPLEQTVKSALFTLPTVRQGASLHIFAHHDPDDANFDDLRSLRVNGTAVTSLYPPFLASPVAGTSQYFASFPLSQSANLISGDAPFTAVAFGTTPRGGFGYPVALAANKLGVLDTVAPGLLRSTICNRVELTATELSNGSPDDEQRQIDQGIAGIRLLDDLSYNARLILRSDSELLRRTGISRFDFTLEPIDPGDISIAKFIVYDHLGNVRLDSLEIAARIESLRIPGRRFRFDETRLGTEFQQQLVIRNDGPAAERVVGLRLALGDRFHLADAVALDTLLDVGEQLGVTVTYIPEREGKSSEQLDMDTVLIVTDCYEYAVGTVLGRGVRPGISVDGDWDAGEVFVGAEECNAVGIPIVNNGSGTLTITGLAAVAAPFDAGALDPALPFTIGEGETRLLRGFCFRPTAEGEYSLRVEILSDADEDRRQQFSEWKGVGLSRRTDLPAEPVMSAIRIAPNPLREKMFVHFSSPPAAGSKIQIVNVLGAVVRVSDASVFPAVSTSIVLYVGDLPAGSYFCRIVEGDHVTIVPILLQP